MMFKGANIYSSQGTTWSLTWKTWPVLQKQVSDLDLWQVTWGGVMHVLMKFEVTCNYEIQDISPDQKICTGNDLL